MSSYHYKLIGCILLVFAIGLSSGYFINSQINMRAQGEQNTSFPLLSKRIYVEDKNDFFLNFQPLRQAVNQYITQNKEAKIEYYFEYLPSGISIGVNERNQTPSGSLVKIPIALAVYKKIEEGSLKETDMLTMREADKDNQFGDLWKKPTGTKLTVEEAVTRSLKYSDNTAHKMLYQVLSKDEIASAFEITDVMHVEVDNEMKPYVSAKSHASLFKALFLSVYLSKEHSNKLLDYMTQTEFNDGLSKYVDEEIKVAHKIGVANFLDKPSNSDCGIVYIPKRPYIICLMVHEDRDIAQEHIAKLSAITFNYVKSIK